MMAPVLLAACLARENIPAVAVDFNILFLNRFVNESYWPHFKNLMTLGHLSQGGIGRRGSRDVLKFTRDTLRSVIDQHDPDYIGLSLFTHESIFFYHVMVYVLRRWWPHIKIVVGGRALELKKDDQHWYDVIHEQNLADLIVVGDAEISIIRALQEKRTGIVLSESFTEQDLDSIPLPKWEDYDLDHYKNFSHQLPEEQRYFSVIGSKGCVRKCSFCDVASFWPRYIYRDGAKIAREIIENHTRTGIKHFRFADNLMNGSIRHYRTMNTVLATEIPNQITYQGYAIFRGKNQMKSEDFATMQKAGCLSWTIGVESGSERVRDHMRKKFTNADIDWTANQLANNGIKQNWLFIVGYPTETDEDFECTIDLLRQHQDLGRRGMIKIGITPPFMLLKSSPLWNDHGLQNEMQYQDDDRSFWISGANPNNTFAVRSQRWFRMMDTVRELGYQFQVNMPVDKWTQEVRMLQEKYAKHKTKTFFLHPTP